MGAVLALNVNIVGAHTAYMIKTSGFGRMVYTFLNKRWLFDKVYNDVFATPAMTFGYHVSFKTLDKGFIEMIGPAGLMMVCTEAMTRMRQLHSGYVYHYALLMLCGVSVCVAVVSCWDFLSPWMDTRLYGIFVLGMILLPHARDTNA